MHHITRYLSWLVFFSVLSPSALSIRSLSFMQSEQFSFPKDFEHEIGFPFHRISIFAFARTSLVVIFLFLGKVRSKVFSKGAWRLVFVYESSRFYKVLILSFFLDVVRCSRYKTCYSLSKYFYRLGLNFYIYCCKCIFHQFLKLSCSCRLSR